jgi:sulfur-oxidizing protein SoxZ
MVSSIRARAVAGADKVEVQTLIQHPMDSGYLKDKAGNVIPPHYIQVVTFETNGKTVFTAFWGPAVSKNPFLKFAFAGGKKGDSIKISWTDNLGKSDTTDAKVM